MSEKTPSNTATGTRRPHKKSRKGCRQCKKRHIKCDEHRPNCQNCINSVLPCDFAKIMPEMGTPSPGGIDQLSPNGTFGASPFTITLSDLELLHHFSTIACFTLGRNPQSQAVWQSFAPRLGLTNLFLLRGILAFAALHLSHLKPIQRSFYRQQALVHYENGLRDFQAALTNLDETNVVATFVYAAGVPAYNFANITQDLKSGTHNDQVLAQIREALFLVRDTGALFQPFQQVLLASEASPILTSSYYTWPKSVPDALKTPELTTLAAACVTSSKSEIEAAAIAGAIEELQIVFAEVNRVTSSGELPDTGLVMRWMVEVPDAFQGMLKAQVPEALVVLAHFATIPSRRNDLWWLQGLGQYLISVIETHLDGKWSAWLQWPKHLANSQIGSATHTPELSSTSKFVTTPAY